MSHFKYAFHPSSRVLRGLSRKEIDAIPYPPLSIEQARKMFFELTVVFLRIAKGFALVSHPSTERLFVVDVRSFLGMATVQVFTHNKFHLLRKRTIEYRLEKEIHATLFGYERGVVLLQLQES